MQQSHQMKTFDQPLQIQIKLKRPKMELLISLLKTVSSVVLPHFNASSHETKNLGRILQDSPFLKTLIFNPLANFFISTSKIHPKSIFLSPFPHFQSSVIHLSTHNPSTCPCQYLSTHAVRPGQVFTVYFSIHPPTTLPPAYLPASPTVLFTQVSWLPTPTVPSSSLSSSSTHLFIHSFSHPPTSIHCLPSATHHRHPPFTVHPSIPPPFHIRVHPYT